MIFQVPIHGSVILLFLLSVPYLFVALAIGLLVSTKAESQREAMQLSMVTFLPSIFFSGYIFPRETMPLPFYGLSFFVPATYFINITRGIILRGAGFVHLWHDGLALMLIVLVAAGLVPPSPSVTKNRTVRERVEGFSEELK